MSIEKVLYIDLQGLGRVLNDNSDFAPAGKSAEMEEYEGGPAGFSEKRVGAKLSCEILKTPAVPVMAIRDFSGSITVQTEEGSTYLMPNARATGEVKLSKGRISVTFESLTSQEVG